MSSSRIRRNHLSLLLLAVVAMLVVSREAESAPVPHEQKPPLTLIETYMSSGFNRVTDYEIPAGKELVVTDLTLINWKPDAGHVILFDALVHPKTAPIVVPGGSTVHMSQHTGLRFGEGAIWLSEILEIAGIHVQMSGYLVDAGSYGPQHDW